MSEKLAPTEPSVSEFFSPGEQIRYQRHFRLSEIGTEGQIKIKQASVLVVGLGGLGSPAALYLAAAGIGRLGLVDFDQVEASNLQRQILYGTSDVGRPKVDSARERLSGLNPNVDITVHQEKLAASNAKSILKNYDLILDGSDNFSTRYLVNDTCVALGKTNIQASISRFQGQITVFDPIQGPCYRCLYPEPPPPQLSPNCMQAGVLGVLPGILGTFQATEALKLILNIGSPLIGRVCCFDALTAKFSEYRLQKDPACLICSGRPQSKGAEVNFEMTPQELQKSLSDKEPLLLIDVREPEEYALANLGGQLIPLRDLPMRISELDPDQWMIVHCHHGMRSARAVEYLRQQGFSKTQNLAGGIDRWSIEINPEIPRY